MTIPVNFSECSYSFTQTGVTRPALVTFGVKSDALAGSALLDAVTNPWSAAGSWRTLLDSTASLTKVRVTQGVAGGTGIVYERSLSLAGTGTIGTSVPPNVAVLIKKTTGDGGRRGRGRMYLPWVCSAIALDDGGNIPAGTSGPILTAMNVWLTQMTSAGVPVYILHDPGKSPVIAPSLVLTLSIDGRVATQRRRMGR